MSPQPLRAPPAEATSPPAGRPPTTPGPRARSAQEQVDRARMRTIAVLVTGILVGVVLSFARTHLAGEFQPLVDSAGVFLVAPFVLGVLMRTGPGAALAGLCCALAQLGAWEATSAARGIPLSAALTVWLAVIGVVGGPLLGASGQLARRGSGALRGLGGAAAAAVLVAEGAWRDLHELHAQTIGWASIAVGAALAVALLRRLERARWLAVAVPLAFAGEIALSQIHP